MTLKDIIAEASKKLDLDEDYVNEVYKSYWKHIRDAIVDLPLKEELDESQFKSLRTNFNIPSLGKLNCTYDYYRRIKDRYKKAIQISKSLSNED